MKNMRHNKSIRKKKQKIIGWMLYIVGMIVFFFALLYSMKISVQSGIYTILASMAAMFVLQGAYEKSV